MAIENIAIQILICYRTPYLFGNCSSDLITYLSQNVSPFAPARASCVPSESCLVSCSHIVRFYWDLHCKSLFISSKVLLSCAFTCFGAEIWALRLILAPTFGCLHNLALSPNTLTFTLQFSMKLPRKWL